VLNRCKTMLKSSSEKRPPRWFLIQARREASPTSRVIFYIGNMKVFSRNWNSAVTSHFDSAKRARMIGNLEGEHSAGKIN
jgi:hypothetical protein